MIVGWPELVDKIIMIVLGVLLYLPPNKLDCGCVANSRRATAQAG
jgi:hypothetical protein